MGAESLFSRVKDMVSHVVDSFIPIAEDEEEEEEIRAQQASQTAQTTQAAQSFASERRVANGGTVSSFSSPSYGSTSSCDRGGEFDAADGTYDEGIGTARADSSSASLR